ncbi:MAG: DUF2851 family protein [Chloroflexi bacterium]|nr:DUF2851 family protein [Chloroflexota bacterium]
MAAKSAGQAGGAEGLAGPGELQIIEAWRGLRGRRGLVTEEGQPLEVIYPGRSSDGAGADLVDAVILSGGALKKGAIEVHTRASGWWSHGHHRDPSYNQVILHVVYRNDRAGAPVLENGGSIGTLALDRWPAGPPADGGVLPCRQAPPGPQLPRIIDRCGRARFLEHAARFRAGIKDAGPGEALYQGIMEALGYAPNRRPFLELSRRLPLRALEAAGRGQPPGAAAEVRRPPAAERVRPVT